MSPNEVHEETEQEVLAPQAQTVDSSTLALLSKSEIEQQVATAKKYPRSISKVVSSAIELATISAETADECIFALPRAGKIIEGPSVRFAEIMAYRWGNCRCGARVVGEDEEFVTSMGSFVDMEQNVHIGYEVKRRVTDKNGKRYNSDMITMTANAACSIALRNAILRGVPKAIWQKVYLEVRKAVAGDVQTLDSRRANALKVFELMGIKRDQVFAKLEIKGIDDMTADHLVTLRGIHNAIKEGETTAARAFAPESTEDKNLAEKSKANLERIKEKYTQADSTERGLRVAPADVAEKNGASQQSEPAQSSGEKVPGEPAAAATDAAAPSDVQEPSGEGSTPGTPAGPEGAAASSGPEFDPELLEQQIDRQEMAAEAERSIAEDEKQFLKQHGLPGLSEESRKGKSAKKR